MADFLAFDKAIAEYNTRSRRRIQLVPTVHVRPDVDDPHPTPGYEDEDNECTHDEIVDENGIMTCADCGLEIQRTIMHEKEWRYYGADSKRSDPNRVQMRKSEERNIFKDVENMGFGDKIVVLANNIYNEVTKGHIYRGNSRKAIVFACIFHAYKLDSKPQPHEKLIKIFALDRKTGLSGLKHVNLNAPKDSKIHTTYITPVHLVSDMMDRFSATQTQKNEVIDLYARVRNRSSKLNRSRPQSVCSGLIYAWIRMKDMPILLREFASRVDLSELTISKIAKEIAEVLGMPGLV